MSIKRIIAQIPLGRWLPLIGGIVFFLVVVGGSIWLVLNVVRPLAATSTTSSGDAGGQVLVTQGQPPPNEAPDVADAAPVQEAPPEGWVRVPAGSFEMGSPESEAGRERDEVRHQVKLTHDFFLMASEVTQGQFAKLLGYNPSSFDGCGRNCPVEQVSWHEAAAFCNRMSEEASKLRCYQCEGSGREVTCNASPSYENPYDCPGYRLPTESEWEYAVRADDMRATYNGDLEEDQTRCTMPNPVIEPIGWFCGNSAAEYEGAFNCTRWGGPRRCGTQPVRQKQANELGLFDMLGNVWEWCNDRYGPYPTDEVEDPTGARAGRDRVLRGGSWGDDARNLRASLRNWNRPEHRTNQVGFRVAITVESGR